MTKEKLQIIDDLVLGNEFCVLATSDGRVPHASLMSFIVDHAAMKFYFLSRKDSTKNHNLTKCPHVSILIDDREKNLALTISGLFIPVKRPQTINAITKLFLAKHPEMKYFSASPDTELIRIEAKSAKLLCGLEDEFSTKFKNS